GIPKMQSKAEKIILSEVSLSQVTAKEALEFLHVKSVELSPDKQGLNFVVKGIDAVSTARLSLNLKDVPLSEALRYATSLAGLQLHFTDNAVTITGTGQRQEEALPMPTSTSAPPQSKSKIMSLVLPQLVFREASLEDVVEYLRTKTKELDPD